jgi:hypothetical protein
MTPHQITTGQQTATAAGALTGTLDISAMAGGYMIDVVVLALASAALTPKARIVIEESADNFVADILPVALYNVQGPIASMAPVAHSWTHSQLPSMRLGATGAKLRVNVVALDGTTPTITASARLWN